MKIRALIVDDEPLARRRLRQLLASEPEVEVAGESGNGRDAIAFIGEHHPDLLFLDVQMPELTGFDVLRALPEESWPAVIFTTAYDQHAVEAFEVQALDFLLKPINQDRFHEAVERALKHIQTREAAAINRQLLESLQSSGAEPSFLSRILVKTAERTIFLKVEDVDYIESAANYVVLHAGAETHVLRDTMSGLESRLSPKLFLRISRSIIVNLERIKELHPSLGGEHVIVLQDGKKLIMTRSAKELQDRLQHL